MKRKRYSEEQIVAAVKQHELGTPAADIARKLGIAEQTFYRWKKQLSHCSKWRARRDLNSRPPGSKLTKKDITLCIKRSLAGCSLRHFHNPALRFTTESRRIPALNSLPVAILNFRFQT